MSPIGISLRKLSTLSQLQTFPYRRYRNRFCTPTPSSRNRVHKLWHSKAWRTDRQKTQRFWPPQWWEKSEPYRWASRPLAEEVTNSTNKPYLFVKNIYYIMFTLWRIAFRLYQQILHLWLWTLTYDLHISMWPSSSWVVVKLMHNWSQQTLISRPMRQTWPNTAAPCHSAPASELK